MRKGLFILLVLAAIAVGVVLAAGELREAPLPTAARTPAELASFVEGVLPGWMAKYRVPGACVGMVAGDLERVLCQGETNSGSGRAVGSGSRFGIASVSKTFTALGVLALANKGAVSLDDPVERHLRVWRFPAGPHDGSAVTIRQLLTHSAGTGVGSYGGAGSPPAGETTRDVLDGRGPGRQPVTLLTKPGSGFRYSGGGYMVLQLLVEDVSGMSFGRFIEEEVFRPLGMRDSSFSWGSARTTDTAGHDVAGRPLPAHPYGAAMAPGAMVTTADDMMRFTSAFARSHLGAELGWPSPAWDEYLAQPSGYGMGIVVGEAGGRLLLGHSGTTMGYDAGFTAAPKDRFGWFVLVNGNGGVFLKSDIDRLFRSWKTGTVDPRHGVVKALRAGVAFLAAVLPALGVLLLVSFALSSAWGRRLRWLGTSERGWAMKSLRFILAALLLGFILFWVVLFHTEAFYPTVTTAWMPYAFRYVTLGVALVALRAALGCVFVRAKRFAPAVTP